jgi:L-histidine N-alpha-methyltransferase
MTPPPSHAFSPAFRRAPDADAIAAEALHDTARAEFRDDVLAGLSAAPKTLPPKYFYDARGCELFERITALPEYYLTRSENAIMAAHAVDMAKLIGARAMLIELGSGSGDKTRRLLDTLHRPAGFAPVDIAPEQLARTARLLAALHPQLRVTPLCADFTLPFDLPRAPAGQGRTVVFFPGSTIGNLEPSDAVALMDRVRGQLGPGGAMLIGIDACKDPAVLERAYADSQGVTAAFNLNLLTRINRELDASFDLAKFVHHACWNARMNRVEMHLLSRCDQLVSVGDATIGLRRGESIHTENSCKYAPAEFIHLARQAGFDSRALWLDESERFSVHFLVRGT